MKKNAKGTRPAGFDSVYFETEVLMSSKKWDIYEKLFDGGLMECMMISASSRINVICRHEVNG